MDLDRTVEDLLLISYNEDWLKKVLIASHIITDKAQSSRNFMKGVKINYPAILEFKKCSILVVIDRIIDVYIFSEKFEQRNTKRVINIVGYNCVLKTFSKSIILKQIMSKKEEFSFLQDSEYKILYFPFVEKGEEEVFNIFREVGKNKFLIDSLSNNLNNKDLNINEASRKELIEMILEDIYQKEEQ